MFTESNIQNALSCAERVSGVHLNATYVCECTQQLSVLLENDHAHITAPDCSALCRAFFLLCNAQKEGKTSLSSQGERRIQTCGPMLDMSRNGVYTVEAVKRFIDRMAVLGLNMLMLYTEDTYEVPEYPYMGWLRGRYSADEIREIDDYAAALGVELIPCIQTLAHLKQMLQWNHCGVTYDLPDILLADDEATYKYLEAQIRSVSSLFTSRRVHIGMDEAHGIGQGKYYERHDKVDRFELLNRHLGRVVALCEQYGLRPMMWSDMFFRLGSETGDYYDENAHIPPQVKKNIPQVEMVYWDYYHQQEELYDHMLTAHDEMERGTVFAGGNWTWTGFLPQVNQTRDSMLPAMRACAKHRVDTVLITMWGDDGAETDFFLAMNGLALFSEHCWNDRPDMSEIERMGELVGCSSNLWNAMALFAAGTDGNGDAKSVIWGDPLLPVIGARGDKLLQMAAQADQALAMIGEPADEQQKYITLVFRVLARKAHLLAELRSRYLSGDRAYVAQAAQEIIPQLMAEYGALNSVHRSQWLASRKPFGWEVLSLRYGAVINRLDDVRMRLLDWLDGTVASVPELDEPLLDPDRRGADWCFAQMVTSSTIL